MRRLTRRDRDEGAFEHFHTEQRAFERGEAGAERTRIAAAALEGDERTTTTRRGVANERARIEPELGDCAFGLGGAGVDRG
jgi:hypothetical protein